MSGSSGRLSYRSAARSHVGAVRKHNEDALIERPEIGLWAVADGMGGHQRGDYASASIMSALSKVAAPESGRALLREVEMRLADVNRTLRAAALAAGAGTTIGSTVVVLLIYDGSLCCLWAGDCRLYRLRAGELSRLTRDHSYVQDLVDQGEIPAEAAATHPMSNVVTNAIGAYDDLELEQARDRLQPEDVLLLCSDGLIRTMSDREIADILGKNGLPEAADRLIAEALSRGAPDNVSVVLVECSA